tara:strand:- start:3677 stop:4624 length:948 start_codon:yes stop_codon:yes gene_type:complete
LNPLVSIIIPTFNRAHLIGETLDSVFEQTYTNWECIIVDDGSTDNTRNVVNDYILKDSRFRYHYRPNDRPKGANTCRNYGFELSKGRYVNWFDDDDVMHSNKLTIQVTALENNECNFSVCQTLIFENSIKNIIGLRSENIHSNNIFYDYLTQKISWLTQAPLWKKSFLQTIDYLFDEELQAAQEWEFHCRILCHSEKYQFINEPLIYIRQHAASISNNNSINERRYNYFLARLKIYNSNEIQLSNESKKFLQEYLIYNFKNFVRSKKIKLALKTFYLYIWAENKFSLKTKITTFLGIFSFFLFGRGFILLKNLKY